MYFINGTAVGANARAGIIPPGKTHVPVELQPLRLYGSPFVTVYPRRLDSVWAQYGPFTVAGFPALSRNALGAKLPDRWATVGSCSKPVEMPRTSRVPW